MNHTPDFLIVGGGIFGMTAAVALQQRGNAVTVIDPGPIPYPLAASTDISKAVRMEYGVDEEYMNLVDQSIDIWLEWNDLFGETLYHNVGTTQLTSQQMQPGDFEYESFQRLQAAGHQIQRLNSDDIRRLAPAFNADHFVDGFRTERGGYAQSGKVVAALATYARQLGAEIQEGVAAQSIEAVDGKAVGVKTADGDLLPAGSIIVAAGAWTPILLPELQSVMKATGHPVFHLRLPDISKFVPPYFTMFGADTPRTGWYGFPVHPQENVLKVARHSAGITLHPDKDDRRVTDQDVAILRQMLKNNFPSIANAQLIFTRRCLYIDTIDEHFWIAPHPELDGLSVATGGSGHGFKFAPVLGDIIADLGEGTENRWLPKFKWRQKEEMMVGQEAARHHE